MSKRKVPVIAFDPGATTGFAAMDKNGEVIATLALTVSELNDFLEFIRWLSPPMTIVVERGPLNSHSPITRTAEANITEMFPKAILVQPSQWKGHPAATWQGLSHLTSRHERDAVCLARWFQARRDNDNSTRTDAKRPRRISH